ncbi:MAG: hypothetical protein AB3N12_01490 [Ruegeria sp.]
MDTSQVINLANWADENLPEITSAFDELQSTLQHNASQSKQREVRSSYQRLSTRLARMSFEGLTNEEIDLIREFGALNFLGGRGTEFLEQIAQTRNFDPASAAADVAMGAQVLNDFLKKSTTARDAILEIGLTAQSSAQDKQEFPLIRVRFKDKASVDDVTLLKKWSTDWYDITRGAALSVGEAPEAVRVVGANNGSIIITLSTVASVTFILAIVAKNAGRIASEVLSIANDIENLRHKKHLNKVIEKELQRQQETAQERGIETTLAEIKEAVPELISKHADNELRKSITKYFDFYEKGGDVDFIPARKNSDEQNKVGNAVRYSKQISKEAQENERLIEVISEVRKQEAYLKQLTHQFGEEPDIEPEDDNHADEQ